MFLETGTRLSDRELANLKYKEEVLALAMERKRQLDELESMEARAILAAASQRPAARSGCWGCG